MGMGMMEHANLITIEPCLDEARDLVNHLKRRLTEEHHKNLRKAFTALAADDPAVGLLAYYIWRRRVRRRM